MLDKKTVSEINNWDYYKNFQKEYKQGRISFAVNKMNMVGVACSSAMKKEYRRAVLFYSWLSILLISGGVISLFFGRWLLALLLIFVGIIVQSANRKSTAEFIVDYALEDYVFLKYAVNTGLITIRQTNEK